MDTMREGDAMRRRRMRRGRGGEQHEVENEKMRLEGEEISDISGKS